MNESALKTWGFLGIILIVVVTTMTTIGACGFTSIVTTRKDITITSKVVHIENLKSYMVVHFSNGETYNINYPYDTIIDFDESKTVTIKLRYSNLFWSLNTDNVWDIVNIIKY